MAGRGVVKLSAKGGQPGGAGCRVPVLQPPRGHDRARRCHRDEPRVRSANVTVTFFPVRRALRRRVTSWLFAVVTVALAASVALGCFAAARRTASAHSRFLRTTNTADVSYASDPQCGDRPCTSDDFAAVDGVELVAHTTRLLSVLERPDGTLAPSDGPPPVVGLGGSDWAIDRPLVTSGRLPDVNAADEAFVSTTFASLLH